MTRARCCPQVGHDGLIAGGDRLVLLHLDRRPEWITEQFTVWAPQNPRTFVGAWRRRGDHIGGNRHLLTGGGWLNGEGWRRLREVRSPNPNDVVIGCPRTVIATFCIQDKPPLVEPLTRCHLCPIRDRDIGLE